MSELICVLWPCEQGGPEKGMRVRLSHDESHHAARVRRSRTGEDIWAITGTGTAARCTIKDPDPSGVTVEVLEIVENWREPRRRVSLYQALVRPPMMDTIVEQGTELGMARLVPIITERVERRGTRLERWRRLAAESAKQCGRGWIPQITEPLGWDRFFSQLPDNPLIVTCDNAQAGLLEVILENRILPEAGPLSIVVGPEGGLVAAELEDLQDIGAIEVNLGSRRLRSETAAVSALALLLQ